MGPGEFWGPGEPRKTWEMPTWIGLDLRETTPNGCAIPGTRQPQSRALDTQRLARVFPVAYRVLRLKHPILETLCQSGLLLKMVCATSTLTLRGLTRTCKGTNCHRTVPCKGIRAFGRIPCNHMGARAHIIDVLFAHHTDAQRHVGTSGKLAHKVRILD